MFFKRSLLLTLVILFSLLFFKPNVGADEGVDAAKAMDQALSQVEDTGAEVSSNTPVKAKRSVPLTYRQKLDEAVTREPQEEVFPWEMDSFVRYMPSKTLKGSDGKISIVDTESELSYEFKAGGRLPIQLSINSEYVGIGKKDFSALSLPAHLTGLSFGAQGTFPFFFDKTYIRFKVVPSFFSANWNAQASSFRIPTYTYCIYQPNQKWTFIAGVAVFPRFEDTVFPIVGFIYQPNDKLTFNIVPSEPYISYQINKMIGVFVNAGMTGGEYRVTKDGYENAILQYNEVHTGAGLEFTFSKNINASISSGYMFNRYLKYRDSLGKASMKNDIYTEFRLEMRI